MKKEINAEITNKANDGSFWVIAQCFYGNRTATEIKREQIDAFLRGYPTGCETEIFDVERKAVLIPGTKNVVVVYDQKQEDEYINIRFPEYLKNEGDRYLERTGKKLKPYISCHIPQINLTLYSRCFICCIDENGELQDIKYKQCEAEDYINYFPER